jgi:endoglucanase
MRHGIALPAGLALVLFCVAEFLPAAGAAAPDAPFPWPREPRGMNIVLDRITDADIVHLAKDWKADSVRLMACNLCSEKEPWGIDPAKRAKLEEVVRACRREGLYTVINLQPPGWNDRIEEFWGSEPRQDAYVAAWKEVVGRYAAGGDGVAYDLMNEPNGKGAPAAWNRLAKRLTKVIREIDPRHVIVVEPPGWGLPAWFPDLEPTGDPNTVYSFHFYNPHDFTHQRGKEGTLKATPEWTKANRYPGIITAWWQGAKGEPWDRDRMRKEIQPALEFGRKHGATLWVGEFGCTRWAAGSLKYLEDCLDLWEGEKLGWAYYSYREWYAMDLERDPEDRAREGRRSETEAVKVFKRHLAR